MKKVMVCLLMLGMIVMLPFSGSATGTTAVEDETMLVDLIKEQYAAQIEEMLSRDEYIESLKNVDLNHPIIRVYIGDLCWAVEADTLEENVSELDTHADDAMFVVFTEEPFMLYAYQDRTKIAVLQYETIPIYIQDIQNGAVRQNFMGEEYEIKKVYCCIIGFFDRWVVYETGGGTFVRYYESDNKAQAAEYSWDEFKEYSLAYQAYIREVMYDENGNLVPNGGGSGSFLEFVEEYKAEKEAQRQAELALQRKKILYISLGAVAVVGAAVTAFLLLRRKRKCKTCEE